MRKWEQKCKDLCRKLVMQGRFCDKCGNTYRMGGCDKLNQHHGLLKSNQRYKLNPFFWYDPTLQFCICGYCHLQSPDAPHVSQERFEDAMMARVPDKIKRLREANTGPLPPTIDARIIDWKWVYANLVIHGRPVGNEILENC